MITIEDKIESFKRILNEEIDEKYDEELKKIASETERLITEYKAKKYEEIVIDKKRSGVVLNKKKLAELKGVIRESENFYLIDIPNNSHIVKLLERIRDESHRFAVSYHTVLKRKGQTEGILEEIPGIGPKTRSKLIRKFGSVSGVINADLSELSKIIPKSKAEIIKKYLGK